MKKPREWFIQYNEGILSRSAAGGGCGEISPDWTGHTTPLHPSLGSIRLYIYDHLQGGALNRLMNSHRERGTRAFGWVGSFGK